MPRAIKQKKTQEGFTLIEIMVVLVILGALAVISVPVYSNYVRRAKISEAISNVEAFATAARIWRMENGTWPSRDNLAPSDDNKKVVNVTEKYFTIAFSTVSGNLVLTANADTTYFDTSGSFQYTLTTDYKGTWADSSSSSNKLLSLYAPYLLPKSTTY